MTDKHDNHIAGAWIGADHYRSNINPSDLSDQIGRFAQGGDEDVDRAAEAARSAFYEWSRLLPYQRAQFLKRISEAIQGKADELGELLSREEGKTLAEGRGEVLRAAQIFDYYAAEAVRLAGEIIPSTRPGIGIEITREPIGPVGIIAPWNFPIAIPVWKIAPALAYGNTVVFKPADLVPASSHALCKIIDEAGVPAGVFNLVMGQGSVVGQRIIDNPDIVAISFTGSETTGKRVLNAAVNSSSPKKLQMEMGGKNLLIVLDDADLETAVSVAVSGSYFSTGQRCTASSRLIVQKDIMGQFIEALKEQLEQTVTGHALKEGTDIGPVVDARQLAQNESYIEIGKAEGADLVTGGTRLNRDTEGFYFSPALFVDASPDMRICREEIFGPIAAVIPAESYEEALGIANDTPFGLSAGICTTSLKHATHFRRESDAGMVMVNLPTAGVDFHVPFGGRKASSYGAREQGTYAREFYTQVKTAYTAP